MKAGIIFAMAVPSFFWTAGIARAWERPAGGAILVMTGHVARANSTADRQLYNQTHFSRSVRQIKEIEVIE